SASRVGVLVTEGHIGTSAEPTLRELSAALIAVYGTDFGAHSPTWLSRFTDTARQAAAYRAGRVLLAGDAAHIHPPDGGQGLNIGVQDAVNLGWKLAQVVKGIAPEPLLDTYQAERHPIAARVLRTTMASVALRGRDDRMQALADTIAEVLGLEQARKHFAGLMSGLDIRYDLGDGHPLVGRRMPDVDVATPSGAVRVFGLLHAARPVLLTFGPSSGFDIAPWAARVQMVHATYQGEWELPVVGVVPAPPAVLVRPDGYVAWAGELADPALAEALSSWFGAPAPG
ncbi:MAG TPA: FAD-dependent monooxygenase, partial [Chloroflexota bacterium]|nr:FAD-dependent monooxygenase [Chloroflexota bacterium]